jgi:hypothetical protein
MDGKIELQYKGFPGLKNNKAQKYIGDCPLLYSIISHLGNLFRDEAHQKNHYPNTQK